MTHTLTVTTPAAAFRRFVDRVRADPNSRSTAIGIMAVIIVHLLLFLVAPLLLRSDVVHSVVRKQAIPRQFNIEIAPDEFMAAALKPTPPPNKYIEANPNAPDVVPDKTTNFSSKNQVLAQEVPQKDSHSEKPKLDGKKDIQSNQTVSGQLTKPTESSPPAPTVTSPQKVQSAPKQAQDPLAGFDKKVGEDGFGSNQGKVADVKKPMPDKVDGSKDAPLVVGPQTKVAMIDPKRPQARPVLQNPHTRPAIFEDNQFGTSNIGPVAYSAKWSNYGAYLHKMFEAIQIQWDRILIDSRTEPPPGTYVTVKFSMDSKGRITEILDVESTSSEQGKQSCVSAITMTAPYGDWTDDMIAILGNSQELTVRFYYE